MTDKTGHFIDKAESHDTGGGVNCDLLHLTDGTLLVISSESVAIYASEEAFWNGENSTGKTYGGPKPAAVKAYQELKNSIEDAIDNDLIKRPCLDIEKHINTLKRGPFRCVDCGNRADSDTCPECAESKVGALIERPGVGAGNCGPAPLSAASKRRLTERMDRIESDKTGGQS